MISVCYSRILQLTDENLKKQTHNCEIRPSEVLLSCANLHEEETCCTCTLSVSVMDGFTGKMLNSLAFANKNFVSLGGLTEKDQVCSSYELKRIHKSKQTFHFSSFLYTA